MEFFLSKKMQASNGIVVLLAKERAGLHQASEHCELRPRQPNHIHFMTFATI